MNVVDWGLIDYEEAWQRQRELADAILSSNEPDTLVFCEHPAIITLGRTTQQGAIVADSAELQRRGVVVVENDRGGEATIHSPGQLVGYPVFNLERTKPDLHWFLRSIEQSIISMLGSFGITGKQVQGLTGVWVGDDRKICAIGIHCKRWVTTHGFALNVNNDLSLFDTIIPCGILDKTVTSMEKELGNEVFHTLVKEQVTKAFRHQFEEMSTK